MQLLKCELGGFLGNIDKKKKEGNTFCQLEAECIFLGGGWRQGFVLFFVSFSSCFSVWTSVTLGNHGVIKSFELSDIRSTMDEAHDGFL